MIYTPNQNQEPCKSSFIVTLFVKEKIDLALMV